MVQEYRKIIEERFESVKKKSRKPDFQSIFLTNKKIMAAKNSKDILNEEINAFENFLDGYVIGA